MKNSDSKTGGLGDPKQQVKIYDHGKKLTSVDAFIILNAIPYLLLQKKCPSFSHLLGR